MVKPVGLPISVSATKMLDPQTLRGSRALVLGSGPLAEAAALSLSSIGAQVMVDALTGSTDAVSSVETHRPDVLVTVAATGERSRAEDVGPDELARTIHADFTVPYSAMLALARFAEGRGAAIVNVTTAGALTGAPGLSAASAAQSALRVAGRSLAAEWAPRDIRVNTVIAGFFAATDDARRVPAYRLGVPRELGDLIAYLCSPYAAYVTGIEIAIDGGGSLRRRLVGEPFSADEFLTSP